MIDGVTLKDAVLTKLSTTGVLRLKGLIITHKYEKFYRVRGSVHKNKNKGVHNADDYFLSDFKNTLNQLYEQTGLNPETTPLNGFEFGVNIKLPINPNNALKCIILHKTNTGSWKDEKHNYKVFGYDNYSDKFYNKSELTETEPYHSENILRIEVNIDKMKHIADIMTYQKLSDLLDAELWKLFEKILIETIQDCLIIDFTDDEVSLLTDKEHIKYLEYINTDYWHKLYEIPKGKRSYETRKKRAAYKVERDECDKFINQHSKSTLKIDIINMVRVKCQELRDVSTANEIEKKWYKFTTFKDEENGTNYPLLKINEIEENGTNYPVDKRVICTKIESTEKDGFKHCLSCGRIIINPRKNQKFCSELVYGKDGKQCRNKDSNPRNNTIRAYNHIISIPLLFDITDYIAPDKRMYLD